MKPVSFGKLREVVTVQVPLRVPDGYGERVLEWETLATTWAAVEPLGATEGTVAGEAVGQAAVKITMRSRPGLDITPDMRILMGNRVFQVRGVIDVEERGRLLEVSCVEVREGVTT